LRRLGRKIPFTFFLITAETVSPTFKDARGQS
jgi:hypothetical protein